MKKIVIAALLLGVIGFQFCTSPKKTQAKAPQIARVTYETDIKPLIATKCSPCHLPPEGRKEPLNTYASVYTNIDGIIGRIRKEPGERGYMPFKKPKLSDSVIHVFEQWKTDGLKEK